MKGIQVSSNEKKEILIKLIMVFFFSLLMLLYNHMCLLIELFSQVSDVAHGPLVFVWPHSLKFQPVYHIDVLLDMVQIRLKKSTVTCMYSLQQVDNYRF